MTIKIRKFQVKIETLKSEWLFGFYFKNGLKKIRDDKIRKFQVKIKTVDWLFDFYF